jgi:hypothetical protein
MWSESWVCVVALLVMFSGTFAAEQQCLRSKLPTNVSMRGDLARVLGRIYDRSPTFRAQCRRIAGADNLRVAIRVDTAIPSRCRAFTIVTRYGYDIRAEVHVPPGNGLTELVAHEFEHVLEQIEGINLRRLARKKDSGVREVEGQAFETDRAQKAGRLVAAEVTLSIRDSD